MPYPNLAAGQRLTAGMLQAMQWQAVEQGSQLTVNNSATLVDTNIIVPLVAGATYEYELMVGYATTDTTDATDFRFAWTAPTNGEVRRWSWGYGSGGTGAGDDYSSVNFRRPITATNVRIGASSDGTTNSYYERGIMIGGDGGNAVFQFAQYVAGAFDSSITGSSRVAYLRIA